MKEKGKLLIHVSVVIIVGTIFFSCKNYPRKTAIATATSATKSYFLFLSDVHLDLNRKETDSTQDTGTDLWNNCKIKIDSILNSPNPPSFVLYTGDLPAHYNCKNCEPLTDKLRNKHDKDIKEMLTSLRKLVSKNKIPLFFVPGNNDAIAGNYYSFADKNKLTAFSLDESAANNYPALNISRTTLGYSHMVSMPDTLTGYYAAVALKGLRIIGLNSIIWGTKYKSDDGISQLDAGNKEMIWLAKQLQDAKDSGDKVYLAMHIPPGTDAYKRNDYIQKYKIDKSTLADTTTWAKMPSNDTPWLNVFLGLATKYKSTITGIFFGHTHFDELRLLYGDNEGNELVQVAISCPGISAEHGNNPAFKIVEFNTHTKLPIDFTTYYTNTKALTWGNNSYAFSSVFKTKAGVSIYESLKAMQLADIKTYMDSIYSAMGIKIPYSSDGIIVKLQK